MKKTNAGRTLLPLRRPSPGRKEEGKVLFRLPHRLLALVDDRATRGNSSRNAALVALVAKALGAEGYDLSEVPGFGVPTSPPAPVAGSRGSRRRRPCR